MTSFSLSFISFSSFYFFGPEFPFLPFAITGEVKLFISYFFRGARGGALLLFLYSISLRLVILEIVVL